MAMDMIRFGGLLFLVSLSGTWAATTPPPTATPVYCFLPIRRTCLYKGSSYREGTYTVPNSGSQDCDTFTCYNGIINIYPPSCQMNGTCVNYGSTLDANCITYTCSMITTNGVYQLSIVPSTSRCTYLGQCINDTGTVVSGCVTRTCNVTTFSNGTILNAMQITSVQCQDDNGACYDSGQRLNKTFAGNGTLSCLCNVNGTSTSYSGCSSV